ncbi:TetR/AcrR family transcriptional regulator [Enterococcus sp. 669A]|uniref:TetR/AcrR family transcriptional regulator n=1 Tax=Candidatus Enterococcus moelleringii TaxID=2815325 RepID=A0ABS3LCP6_9ENTE|nr:TetR/AcrR family transcriptional regulator [Enterococcus sp. 669A]MBO1307401.1 TetR/AcrR family transcriptional regulator [Enterococcus sp. 669A]
MPSKPVLSEEDKENIKQQLLSLCEQLWVLQGYKKTSIKQLCSDTAIAIGTFYSLYSTKEELFFETAKAIQVRLTDQFLQTVLQGANQASLAKALKELFREFDSKPFLYDVNTPDFRAFVTKLSDENMEELKFESISFFREVCKAAQLKPKVDDAKAFGVLSALLSTVATKQTLSEMYDYFEIFDFMVDKLVAELFE